MVCGILGGGFAGVKAYTSLQVGGMLFKAHLFALVRQGPNNLYPRASLTSHGEQTYTSITWWDYFRKLRNYEY